MTFHKVVTFLTHLTSTQIKNQHTPALEAPSCFQAVSVSPTP